MADMATAIDINNVEAASASSIVTKDDAYNQNTTVNISNKVQFETNEFDDGTFRYMLHFNKNIKSLYFI